AYFFFSSRRRHTRSKRDWSSDVCSSDLTGGAPPEVPVFFTKPPTCVIGPGAPVTYHTVTQALDYEVELAVVFGRRGRDIPAAKRSEERRVGEGVRRRGGAVGIARQMSII